MLLSPSIDIAAKRVAVHYLFENKDESWRSICQAGGINALCHSLTGADPEVKRCAADTLGDLAMHNPIIQKEIVENGGIAALCALLKDDDFTVRASAAYALGILAANRDCDLKIRNTEIKAAIVAADCISTLRGLLGDVHHPSNVCYWAAYALFLISEDSPSMQSAIVTGKAESFWLIVLKNANEFVKAYNEAFISMLVNNSPPDVMDLAFGVLHNIYTRVSDSTEKDQALSDLIMLMKRMAPEGLCDALSSMPGVDFTKAKLEDIESLQASVVKFVGAFPPQDSTRAAHIKCRQDVSATGSGMNSLFSIEVPHMFRQTECKKMIDLEKETKDAPLYDSGSLLLFNTPDPKPAPTPAAIEMRSLFGTG